MILVKFFLTAECASPVPREGFFKFPQSHARDGADGCWKLQRRWPLLCASAYELIGCPILFLAFEQCTHYNLVRHIYLYKKKYLPESILGGIVTLEQLCNFNVVDPHGIVINKWSFYEFVRSYKNIKQMNFRPEKKSYLWRGLCWFFCIMVTFSVTLRLALHWSSPASGSVTSMSPLWPIPLHSSSVMTNTWLTIVLTCHLFDPSHTTFKLFSHDQHHQQNRKVPTLKGQQYKVIQILSSKPEQYKLDPNLGASLYLRSRW